MNSMTTRMVIALAAVFALISGAFLASVPVAAAADLNDDITTEEGPTDLLGGGNHFFVRFGDDAAFGIVWGTDTVENNVYFVAIKARYLGFAEIYDANGKLLDGNRTIKTYTLYAVKLDSLLEFNDVNDDGALSYYRTYDSGEGAFSDYVASEPLYKKVDLNTSWNASDVTEETLEDSKTWTFSLTANDEPYEALNPGAEAVGDNVLNNFTLTFNLEASLVEIDNASMPKWRIEVQLMPGALAGETYVYRNTERLENVSASGKLMSYDVKWDQMIEGWDYDPENANPMLMLEFGSVVMNAFKISWMNTLMLRHMNAVGVMNCENTAGDTFDVNESTGTLTMPERIKTSLNFGADWSNIGALTWVDEVTVDGEPELVRAQIMAGHTIMAMGKLGTTPVTWVGFVALGGMAFPGGGMIVHDPTFSSTALVDVASETSRIPGLLTLLAIAIVVIVVIAVIAVARDGKKPGKGVQGSYEKSSGTKQGDWSKYYNKK